MQFFTPILVKWSVLMNLAMREIRMQYVGSALGMVWQFITPLVLILVFWVVFSVGFRVQPASGVPFAVWLTAGMAVWFAFSEIVSGSVHAITSHPHLVKKVVFPVQALPLIKVISSFSNHLFFLAILVALMLILGVGTSFHAFQIVYYFFCMVALALGIGWTVAALNVFARDTARLVGVLLQVGMWATPILWDINILPQPWRSIFAINPMHYVVQGYRDSLFYSVPVSDRIGETILFWIITGSLLALGVIIFKRLRPQFADLV
ncbi:MAG: ABC transporter permease [Arenicellales bacterium]